MKKTLAVFLASVFLIVMFASVASAQIPTLSDALFTCAKNTLTALAAGEYARIVEGLPFAGAAPTAQDWEHLGAQLQTGSPQTQYAVAYRTSNEWKVVVPISEPASSGVQCLYLMSSDGKAIDGYGLTQWGIAESEYRASDYVLWKSEYWPASSALVEFDVDA